MSECFGSQSAISQAVAVKDAVLKQWQPLLQRPVN